MNLLNTYLTLNGRLVRNSPNGFWQVGSLEGTLDPSIPNLPLNTAAAGGALSVAGDAGAYTISGTAATLERGRKFAMGSASYAITGTSASLEHGWKISAGDPNFASVVLQVEFFGPNGSTTFTDESPVGNTLVPDGNAQIQSNYLELDGTTDFVAIADSANWQLTGDFTLEFFGVQTDNATGLQCLASQYDAFTPITNQRGWALYYRGNLGTPQIDLVTSTNGTAATANPVNQTLTAGVDYNITIERSGTTLRYYVNGTMIGSVTQAASTFNSTSAFVLGTDNARATTLSNLNEWDGRIKAVRFTQNVARYATNSSYSVPPIPFVTAYEVTGTSATLTNGREIVGGSGAYAITGTDATLTKSGGSKSIAADGGTYAVTGTTAALEYGREVLGLSGSYTITGTAASLEYGREALALGGTYAVTGTAASLERGREVLALAGSYAITGTDATLTKAGGNKTVAANGGSYAISGTPATLVYQSSAATGGGHAWKGPAEPNYRVHPEYEDKPKKKRKREKVGEQVILAGEPEIQTGIIEVTPARDALGELQQMKDEAERIRRAKLRALALADDDWLMVA